MTFDEFAQLTEFCIPLDWKWEKAPFLKESGKCVSPIPGMSDRAITVSKSFHDWGDYFSCHAGYYAGGGMGWEIHEVLTDLRSKIDHFYGIIQSVLLMPEPDKDLLLEMLRQSKVYRPTVQELNDFQLLKDNFLSIEQVLCKMYATA